MYYRYTTPAYHNINMEPPRRFELRTPALRKRCSSQLSQGGTPSIVAYVAKDGEVWYDTPSTFCACSEVGLSRLPVTEEIAGSNPVGRAI